MLLKKNEKLPAKEKGRNLADGNGVFVSDVARSSDPY
jgi:hypothetical protein